MLKQFAPYLAQVAGQVLRDAAIEALRNRPRAINVSPWAARQETACPYCTVTKQLAGVYRYLRRAISKPALAEVYITLSKRLIVDAQVALETESVTHQGLAERLRALYTGLNRARSSSDLAALAQEAWEASELSLDLAEYASGDNIKVIEGAARPAAGKG